MRKGLQFAAILVGISLSGGTGHAGNQTAVEAIQEALIWTKFYEGPLDGRLGPGSIAAINRFKKNSGDGETGELTDSQLEELLKRATELRTPLRFTSILDAATGTTIGLPLALVPNMRAASNGVDYFSADQSIVVGLRRYRTNTQFSKLFQNLRESLAGTQIEYSVQRANWFVLSGSDGANGYYMRYHYQPGEVAGFFVIKKQTETSEVPLSMMSFTFRPFSSAPAANIRTASRVLSIELAGPLAPLKNQVRQPAVATPSSNQPISVDTSSYSLMEGVKKSLVRFNGINPKFHTYVLDKDEMPGLVWHVPILRILFDERVFFDFAQSDVRSDGLAILDAVATSFRDQSRDGALFVAGHTDARGSDEYNLDLSTRRATSVAEELQKRGIGSVKIWRVGFGKAVPLRPNDSALNMSYNRRVEFLVAASPDTIATWLARHSEELCTGENIRQECKPPSASSKFAAVPLAGKDIADSFPPAPRSPNAFPKDAAVGQSTPLPKGVVSIQSIQTIEIDLQTRTIEVGPPLR